MHAISLFHLSHLISANLVSELRLINKFCKDLNIFPISILESLLLQPPT